MSTTPASAAAEGEAEPVERRRFLGGLSDYAMAGSLLAAYGTFGVYGGRYLYPAKDEPASWLFVTQATNLEPGEAIAYETPQGAKVTVTRRGEGNSTDDFLALSSTCPHLGCKVFWEPQNARFFCPCHNGVFAPDGSPKSGPPADANQSLLRYPLEVRDGLLFILVPTTVIAAGEPENTNAPGAADAPGERKCDGGAVV